MEELRVWLWRYYRLMKISFDFDIERGSYPNVPITEGNVIRMGQVLAFLESVPEWHKPTGSAPDPLPVWPEKPEDVVL